jgi:hypothetical protein
MPYATLETLRSRLRTRLGYSAVGAAAGGNQVLLNDFLQSAQVALYNTHDWAHLRFYHTLTINAGEYLTDYPTIASDAAPADCNPERVRAISINRGGIWSPPLKKGITPQHYTTQDQRSWPRLWEPYAQIETWPKADQSYDMRIFYIGNLLAFSANDDRATIDDEMIFLIALGDAKGHYRHPDAKTFQDRGNNLLAALRSRSWGQTVFRREDYTGCEEEEQVKPVVV